MTGAPPLALEQMSSGEHVTAGAPCRERCGRRGLSHWRETAVWEHPRGLGAMCRARFDELLSQTIFGRRISDPLGSDGLETLPATLSQVPGNVSEKLKENM